ncbi:CsbD-like [Micromonospora nigra]|uniref:CsbD-like n=1 Tax=Micromonospora nigra TaxID=145857 RepID=A0A1C6T3F5_9ACTN|nr:CsbD family protein [Micromonospora nigra]SCL36169.1 CsbD-like [Micromonospora nigra]
MSFTDKARNKVEELTGAARRRIGDMTDNERMRSQGSTQQGEARAKQVGEHAKQSGRTMKDAATR